MSTNNGDAEAEEVSSALRSCADVLDDMMFSEGAEMVAFVRSYDDMSHSLMSSVPPTDPSMGPLAVCAFACVRRLQFDLVQGASLVPLPSLQHVSECAGKVVHEVYHSRSAALMHAVDNHVLQGVPCASLRAADLESCYAWVVVVLYDVLQRLATRCLGARERGAVPLALSVARAIQGVHLALDALPRMHYERHLLARMDRDTWFASPSSSSSRKKKIVQKRQQQREQHVNEVCAFMGVKVCLHQLVSELRATMFLQPSDTQLTAAFDRIEGTLGEAVVRADGTHLANALKGVGVRDLVEEVALCWAQDLPLLSSQGVFNVRTTGLIAWRVLRRLAQRLPASSTCLNGPRRALLTAADVLDSRIVPPARVQGDVRASHDDGGTPRLHMFAPYAMPVGVQTLLKDIHCPAFVEQ